MELTALAKTAEKFAVDNSPLLLTAMGAAGVVTTAVLASKASFKASEVLKLEQRAKARVSAEIPAPELTFKEKVNATWKLYIPAAGTGLLTVTAIVGANQISTKRAAAVAAAYSVSEKAFTEYREKVAEKWSDAKEKQVRDEVAQDRIMANPPTPDNVVIVSNGGNQIFQDSWSGRYFTSTAEEVKQAVNELNHQLNLHGHATLTDFYDLLGLSKTLESDEVGWSADKLLDVYFAAVLHDNGQQPVMAMEYRVVPSRDYFRFH